MTDYTTLKQDIDALALRVSELEDIITRSEKKASKARRSDSNSKVQLIIMKQDFVESDPRNREDLNEWELVLWASYVLKDTSRREMLESMGEVAKRTKRIKEVVKHFGQQIRTSDEKMKEQHGRMMTKHFIEYVLTEVPEFQKNGQTVPMSFWPALSEWSVNNNSAGMHRWLNDKKLDKFDTPPVEDD